MHKLASCVELQVNTYLRPSFADHMGKYELAESDHVSIVNVTCIEREFQFAIAFQVAV